VTAGVLRGERSRFQLFGDTMNKASRMESTGLPGHIQVSAETAKLLMAAGKDQWVTPRATKVFAKGKGEVCHSVSALLVAPRASCIYPLLQLLLAYSLRHTGSTP
jgi:class 3 adenylate cyclase